MSDALSTTSLILETYLGVRWQVWSELELIGGFRNTRYTDVGVDLRPVVTSLSGGVNLQDVREVDRSVTYEGFYGAVAYRF